MPVKLQQHLGKRMKNYGPLHVHWSFKLRTNWFFWAKCSLLGFQGSRDFHSSAERSLLSLLNSFFFPDKKIWINFSNTFSYPLLTFWPSPSHQEQKIHISLVEIMHKSTQLAPWNVCVHCLFQQVWIFSLLCERCPWLVPFLDNENAVGFYAHPSRKRFTSARWA